VTIRATEGSVGGQLRSLVRRQVNAAAADSRRRRRHGRRRLSLNSNEVFDKSPPVAA